MSTRKKIVLTGCALAGLLVGTIIALGVRQVRKGMHEMDLMIEDHTLEG